MFTGKKILIRADASLLIGTGHVMRCLSLANHLKSMGAECYFAIRLHVGHLRDKILEHGHFCLLLEKTYSAKETTGDYSDWLGCTQLQDANETIGMLNNLKVDLCVVDHYALDSEWENRLKEKVKKIIVIDDLANRTHNCDILIDQNAGRIAENYRSLTTESCNLLLGTKYALLREEFSALRDFSLSRRINSKISSVLISMGGVDSTNATQDVLSALGSSKLPRDCCINIVIGSKYPWIENINKAIENFPWKTSFYIDTRDMGKLLSESDLAIGAAGSSAWERCVLGVPSVMIVVAENQRVIAESLKKLHAALVIDSQKDIPILLPKYICDFVDNATLLPEMSFNSALVADGRGVERVAFLMGNLL